MSETILVYKVKQTDRIKKVKQTDSHTLFGYRLVSDICLVPKLIFKNWII